MPDALICDSCGAADDDLVELHRLYVTPEDWDTDGKVEEVQEVERWCYPCRTMYPHRTLDEEAEGAEAGSAEGA